jgi:tRNA A37 threonylcarbamoyltransferase TsaD
VVVQSPRSFGLLTPPPVLSRPQSSEENAPEMTISMKDLSIGNAYDKVAKLLGLSSHKGGLGHGAALERFCLDNPMEGGIWEEVIREAERSPQPGEANGRKRRLTLVVPSPGQLMFSYAGLYSEIKQFVERQALDNSASSSPISDKLRIALAHAFQHTAVEQLEEKMGLALRRCDANSPSDRKIKEVVTSGGVASNMFLRQR